MSMGTMGVKSLEFTWKITNYSQKKLDYGPGKWISSQAFYDSCVGDMKFTLQFYPQGSPGLSFGEKWTSLGLVTECRKKYDTSHYFEFSILDANGEKFAIYHFHRKIPFTYGYRNFITLKKLENPANNLLPNDTLTICCRVVETKSESEECRCQIEEPQTTIARRKLGEDLAGVLGEKYADFVFKVENEKIAAFVFKVKNEKIAAHKVILAARSPVFDAMFQRDRKENKTNEAEITDVTPAAFKTLLRFIYTGHCEVDNLAEELLVAANKYDIPDLKQICAKELRFQLTVDNAVRLLVLSDLHQAEDLKDGAMRFINKNAAAVMKTPSWSNFPKTHQHLIFELYRKLVESK
jgi:speckle-type POZ protein